MRTAAATLRLLPRAAAGLPRAVRLSPHWRRRLIALGLLAVALAAVYLFWLRDSSLVRVEQVTVKGLDTPDAARVSAKLSVAARQMTTLHVNEDALRRAVADEP
ncbi:MAG: cell division protein FtsQ, partial [Solirubrobacteraceae bacterium]|nr:cell division protein FtsQ [Solirubrobacteraceae bacterium]